MRTARNAAVSSEINQLAQALESFKSKYGDYPPSRVILSESGNYATLIGNTSSLSAAGYDKESPSGNDPVTVGMLAQRTLVAMRKFFPKVIFSTSGNPPLFNSNSYWYDFNGNGSYDSTPYVLHGHECLVFFLGGIPAPATVPVSASTLFGLSGFGKDPTNPFSNNNANSSMYNTNRQPSLFDFNPGRLFVDPNGLSGVPGYYDTLGSATDGAGTNINFYAYFSA